MKNSSSGSTPASPTVTAAKEAVTSLKEKVSDTAQSVTFQALDQAASRKADAADNIDRVSGALHHTADDMAEKDPNIAHFAHRIADRLDGASGYLRNRSLNALKEDACRVARDHPVAFFGGLFAAGLVLGSLIKAGISEPAADPGNGQDRDDSQARTDSSDAPGPQAAWSGGASS